MLASVAGSALTAAGAATLASAHQPGARPLALLPLLLGVQPGAFVVALYLLATCMGTILARDRMLRLIGAGALALALGDVAAVRGRVRRSGASSRRS